MGSRTNGNGEQWCTGWGQGIRETNRVIRVEHCSKLGPMGTKAERSRKRQYRGKRHVLDQEANGEERIRVH